MPLAEITFGTVFLGVVYEHLVQLLKALEQRLPFTVPDGGYRYIALGLTLAGNVALVLGAGDYIDLGPISDALAQADSVLEWGIVFVGSPLFALLARKFQKLTND